MKDGPTHPPEFAKEHGYVVALLENCDQNNKIQQIYVV